MQSWCEQAIEEWNELRAKAARVNWPSDPDLTMQACARACGATWFYSRPSDTVSEFLGLSGLALVGLYGFGHAKVERLINIVRESLKPIQDDYVPPPPPPSLQARLAVWDVPSELPCDLVRLPTRIRNYCGEHEVHTLGELLAVWQAMGSEGLLAQKNLGRRSVGEIEALCDAVRSGDRASASRWLPLAPDGNGLSLWIGLERAVQELEPDHREMLEKRLVDQRTLEESAAAFGITRERVRQLEALLMQAITRLLDWFPEAREAMVNAWMEGGEWQTPLNAIGNENDRQFLAASLESYFNELPQGAARSLEHEEALRNWHEMLRSHPDLLVEGVDLDAFMHLHVPDHQRDTLCHSLNGRGRIKLDHGSGRVIHTDPRLREVVKAILAREDDPIPLTWLLELVRQTPSHPDAQRHHIEPYKAQWKSDDPSFPREKIIWHE